ncbi:MAG: 23S rRNA (adenine(2503)-C(2))-methyltransferase RlmN [Candidatus Margulisbacteria bacterium]|nr:23S rRNA (adenine(2503)-C(2))-methyltransferase RlmN [Candidatus Margulisiibacteriota bacterium]
MSNDIITFMKNFYDLNLEELTEELQPLFFPVYKIKEIFSWIYKKNAADFEQITTLSKQERNLLAEKFTCVLPAFTKIVSKGSVKYRIALNEELIIESVVLKEKDYYTLCVSSQAGCPLGCVFCATGKYGFRRNLTAGEIIAQYMIAVKSGYVIKNLVFMGMGEPLLNIAEVLKAVHVLNHKLGANIGIRNFTISTSGILAGIERLLESPMKFNLAISLNAGDDSLRSSLMPVNKTNPLSKLLRAASRYAEKTGRRVSFEYVLLKNINDSALHAQQLVKALRHKGFHINLIPFNNIDNEYIAPSVAEVKNFANILTENGLNVTIRYSKGAEISAACGMLANKSCF